MSFKDILQEIFDNTLQEVDARKKQIAEKDLITRVTSIVTPTKNFITAMKKAPRAPALVAEIKRRSPSKGELIKDFNPCIIAGIYAQNGASAISVVTDEKFFGGSLTYLRSVAKLSLPIPLLRKDFIADPYQVYEAREAGADAVLLIVAMLSDDVLRSLRELIESLGMTALIEVHNAVEVQRALHSGAPCIGINNRNLHTFEIDLATSETVAPLIPPGVMLIAESGINTLSDIERLRAISRHDMKNPIGGILVGEALVTSPDIAEKTKILSGTY